MTKFINLILAVAAITLLAGCSNDTVEEVAEETPEPAEVAEVVEPEEVASDPIEHDYDYYLICDNNRLDFVTDETGGAHGEFSLTGTVVTTEEVKPFQETETATFIRMKVTSSNSDSAFEYFQDMANRGNSINRMGDGELKFAIGLVEDNSISSTATIPTETQAYILAAADTDEEITLDMVLPFHIGRGAPANFTFACEIK